MCIALQSQVDERSDNLELQCLSLNPQPSSLYIHIDCRCLFWHTQTFGTLIHSFYSFVLLSFPYHSFTFSISIFYLSYIRFSVTLSCYIISKKDGHRYINRFEQYEDILIYCKNRMLFNISMTAFLVL